MCFLGDRSVAAAVFAVSARYPGPKYSDELLNESSGLSTQPPKPLRVKYPTIAFPHVDDMVSKKLPSPSLFQPPLPDDTATICFTAGTGDTPRGVVLSHAGLVSAVHALLLQLDSSAPNSGDVLMSYLPLAHMLERICEVRRGRVVEGRGGGC